MMAWTEYYSSGTSDFSPSLIMSQISTDGGRTWNTPSLLQENLWDNVKYPNFVRLPSDEILLFFRGWDSTSEAAVYMKRSSDEGANWSDMLQISEPESGVYWNNADHAITLSSGRVILPTFTVADGAPYTGGDLESFVYYSDDGFQTCHKSETMSATGRGAHEPSFVELSDGRLLCFMRTKPLGDKVTHLRIIQLLPKTTPVMDDPPVGLRYVPGLTIIGAAPAKQVLGTVPVEEDGSAYFEVPSKTPILFQALDAQGRAVQTMRSITYLQPGEKSSCVGCHESRTSPPLPIPNRMAFARAPSKLKPGPKGSKPFSYPLLVQPVLDRHCVECHNPQKPEGKVVLTSEPDGHYTKSYNALVPHVAVTAWGMPHGNHEPMTLPGQFGSRASRLVKLLDDGHYDVKLTSKEWNRLTTWIDTNALFYGTYNRKNQAKQQKGLEITGPDME